MGVVVDIEADIGELMTKLGCQTNLILQAQQEGLQVTYEIGGVRVHDLNKKHFQIAPIKLGVLQSILSGNLGGGAAKEVARVGMEKAVKHVLTALGKTPMSPDFLNQKATLESMTAPTVVVKQSSLEVETNIDPEVLKVMAGIPTDKSVFDGKPGAKCALSEAKALYQPVNGSDVSSTYFAVALSDALKVAVRIKGGSKVSIRVEGAGISNHKKHLMAAGLSGTDNHFSVHLSADSPELARKCVGAVLFGINWPFAAVASDLTPIWSKGT